MTSMDTSDEKLRMLSTKAHSEKKPKSGGMQQLLAFNRLGFSMLKQNSLTSARALVAFRSERNQYTQSDQSIKIYIQSGTQYVSPDNSVLTFTVNLDFGDAATTYGFGIGSSQNLFNEVRVTSRSGVELCRLKNANTYIAHKIRLTKPHTWFESVGNLAGYHTDLSTSSEGHVSQTSYTFAIPLSHIASVFDYPGKLLPHRMLSGSVLELFLETPKTAVFSSAAAASVSYTISNVKLLLDCHKLVDQADAALEEISASNSLEVVNRAIFSTTQATTTASNTININKAVSRGLRAFMVKKRVDHLNTTQYDSMAAEDYATDNETYQWRCGAMFYPQAPIQNRQEALFNLKYSADQPSSKISQSHPQLITPAVTLESSSYLNFAGQSLNNSRILSIDHTASDSQNRQVFLFLEYVSLLRVFLHNIVRLE